VSSTGRTSQPAGQERPGSAPQGQRRREAWVLTGDDALLIEIGPALGDRYRTRLADDAQSLEHASLASAVLLLDASTQPDARALAQRLATRHPQLPVVVFCADGDAFEWQAHTSTPNVCAVLERGQLQPAAVARALADAERRIESAGTVTTSNALSRLELPSGDVRRTPWAAIGAGVLVLVAVGTWLALRPHGPPAAAETAAASGPVAAPGGAAAPAPGAAPVAVAPQPAALPPRSTLELLSDARVAFRDEKLQLPRVDGTPQGDSALELYQRVLAQEPDNDEARDGMRRLLALTRDRIQSDLANGRIDEAARLVAAYRDSGVAGDEIAKLAGDVNAARPRLLMQQARTALAAGDLATATGIAAQLGNGTNDSPAVAALKRDIAARGADQALLQQVAQVRAAIAAGTLLEPAGDSARARLQALQQSARGNPATVAVARELQLALVGRAQQALRVGDTAQAQAWLAPAAEYGNGAELQSAQAELRAALEQQSQRASAASEPARAAASAPPRPSDWYPARPLKALQVDFPRAARAKGLSGYAIVEFLLSADGRARDAHVVESSPPGAFDAAAVGAVNSGRFDLNVPQGIVAAGQHGRLRVTFRLDAGPQGARP
jgi:TonB family protein